METIALWLVFVADVTVGIKEFRKFLFPDFRPRQQKIVMTNDWAYQTVIFVKVFEDLGILIIFDITSVH